MTRLRHLGLSMWIFTVLVATCYGEVCSCPCSGDRLLRTRIASRMACVKLQTMNRLKIPGGCLETKQAHCERVWSDYCRCSTSCGCGSSFGLTTGCGCSRSSDVPSRHREIFDPLAANLPPANTAQKGWPGEKSILAKPIAGSRQSIDFVVTDGLVPPPRRDASY